MILRTPYACRDKDCQINITLTHTQTGVIQYNEYYPFGLQTANSWTRANNRNDYLYNAASELNQSSGWYETFFRGYDPALGRFHAVDPLAEVASSFAPYQYGYDNPVLFNDPTGAIVKIREGDWWNYMQGGRPVDYRLDERAYAGNGFEPPGGFFGDHDGLPRTWGEYIFQRASVGDPYAVQQYARIYGNSITDAGLINGILGRINAGFNGDPSALNFERNYTGESGWWVDNSYADSEGVTVITKFASFAGNGGPGLPIGMWVDPSSLNLKKIGDAWYGSAHIDEEILALKLPNGVARVHLNTTVNFNFSASMKKNFAQYIVATAMDRARAAVWEELYANPAISSATAARDFKEFFAINLMRGTFGSEVKSYAFPGVPTFEVKFQLLPSLPPRTGKHGW